MRNSMLCWTLAASAFAPLVHATELLFEDFESQPYAFALNTADVASQPGATGSNKWVVNAAYAGGTGTIVCLGFPFSYTVATTPSQPGSIVNAPNSAYLHILSNDAEASGILAATYSAADGLCFFEQNHFARMSSSVSTVGQETVELQFHWVAGGSQDGFGEVYASIDEGASWILLTEPPGKYFGTSQWQAHSLWLPQFAGQPSLRFGFRWVNRTASTASDPAFSIDDVRINAYVDDVFLDGFESTL